jgi:hypothetical protein
MAGIATLERKGMILIRCEDGAAFIEAAVASGLWIVGIEGFDVSPDWIRPDTDAMTDFSRAVDAAELADAARSFLRAAGRPGLYLDCALSEQSPAGTP